jgi:hypothetical protein
MAQNKTGRRTQQEAESFLGWAKWDDPICFLGYVIGSTLSTNSSNDIPAPNSLPESEKQLPPEPSKPTPKLPTRK